MSKNDLKKIAAVAGKISAAFGALGVIAAFLASL
jgi:hypothetical protein